MWREQNLILLMLRQNCVALNQIKIYQAKHGLIAIILADLNSQYQATCFASPLKRNVQKIIFNHSNDTPYYLYSPSWKTIVTVYIIFAWKQTNPYPRRPILSFLEDTQLRINMFENNRRQIDMLSSLFENSRNHVDVFFLPEDNYCYHSLVLSLFEQS